MFQEFDPVSDRTFASKHLPLLRAAMTEMGLDGFVIPHDDEYQNEYIPAYAERLMWATGFSGSAGSAVILQDSAAIFTDGRYTLQVRAQADDQYFDYIDSGDMTHDAWLAENGPKGGVIGYDPLLHTPHAVERLTAAAAKAGFTLQAVTENPIDKAWTNQPAKPAGKALVHDTRFAGSASADKRAEIGKAIAKHGADAALITAPPSVAWLFNIRGGDVARTPLPLSRAIIFADGAATLFIDPGKTSDDLRNHLGNEVALAPEAEVEAALAKLGQDGKSVLVDPGLAPAKFVSVLTEAGGRVIRGDDPCALPRAVKNETEITGARDAHVRDGAAVTRFLHWLAHEAPNETVDEIGAAKALEGFRAETGELIDLSFDSITGSGGHGALPHYRVTTDSNRTLKNGELFLIDSGGQYKDGTTDITRTIPIGAPTQEMRERFTQVLKGHIALAQIRFPKGTTGHQLDAIARAPLWMAGLDYDHGTGHGVGSFLGVHEGPQRIAKAANSQALFPGMILSNEPGYYKADTFGIRIENLVVVTKPEPIEGGEREMMGFETITLAPISLDLVIPAMLSEAERHWLNQYHARVRQTLTPLVPGDVAAWLKNETRAI